MMRSTTIPCSECEGTGRRTNTFDPPCRARCRADLTVAIQHLHSPSGRATSADPCAACHGRGRHFAILPATQDEVNRAILFALEILVRVS
jgi:DnaJ-class molecular chaperone